YDYSTEYFKDEAHNNYLGANEFSRSLGRLLRMVEKGEDTSKCFYNDWGIFLTSITWLENVEFWGEAEYGEGITLSAVARTGSWVEPQYLFQYYDEEAGEYVTFRSYGESGTALYVPEKSGTYYFRVIAKRGDDDDGIRRYKTLKINYFAK
nr:hypothetical protein [Eubacterium sp.]